MAKILELIDMYFHLYICFIIFFGYIIILEVAKKERIFRKNKKALYIR